ncbi:MAG TPA: hypothetical protein VK171_07100 [Fimbriimonas sp.]|nr:hypothetical protein [Fimbriimonas sp.]
MLPVLFLEFMRTRVLLLPYWDEWLEADGYPVFEEWIAEAHPEILETARDKKKVLKELVDLYEARFWHHSIIDPESVFQAQRFASLDAARYKGIVEKDEEVFPTLSKKTFSTPDRFLSSVQYCYHVESSEQVYAVKVKDYLAPGSMKWQYEVHEAEKLGDEVLLDLFSEGKPLNREIVIRRRFGGIPNSWSPGHEHQLPLSLQDYSRFPYKLGNQPDDYGCFAEDPELAQEYADSMDYYDSEGNLVDPYEEYRPHEFVTQDIPEGCWWV